MEQLREWWENISPREQLLTIVSAVVICIAALYWGGWVSLKEQLTESKKQLTRAEATLSWTQEKATVLLESGAGKPQAKRVNLTQILNRSAKQNGITFSRIVNKKDQVEVWISDVEFDQYIKWLTTLSNKHGVSVINVDIAKTARKGHIKVNRLLLGN